MMWYVGSSHGAFYSTNTARWHFLTTRGKRQLPIIGIHHQLVVFTSKVYWKLKRRHIKGIIFITWIKLQEKNYFLLKFTVNKQ
jgi:hypothetical protein